MILPIGDSPNPRSTPWITWALIAVNVAVYLLILPLAAQRPSLDDPAFLDYLRAVARSADEARAIAAQTSRYDLFLFEHGFRPAQPDPLDLLKSMFLHGGLAHLAGNMLFLWIFGNNVEHRMGRAGYLAAYLGTGVVAALGDFVLRMGSEVPSVGASGAISGVLGFYFVWFPQNRVHLWVFMFPFLMDVIELPARFVLGAYVVLQNLLPLLLAGSETGVAYGAHLGGFFAGAVVASMVRAARPALEPAPAGQPPEALELPEAFRAALDEGRLGEALWLLLRHPRGRTRPVPAADVLELAARLEAAGRAQDALAAYLRVVTDRPRGRELIDAHLGAARLLLTAQPTLAYQHLRAALEGGPDVDQEQEARRLLQDLARWTRSLPRGTWRSV